MLDLNTRSRLAAQSEGTAARRLGRPRDRNPYRGHDTEPPSLWCQWDIGWDREDLALDRAIATD